MWELSLADHAWLRDAEAEIGRPLIVTKIAVVGVLCGLIDGRFEPATAQAWASLMRRGYIEGSVEGAPVDPIDIEFEEAWEDGIAAAVSRLDEIGDTIDGEVTSGEVLDLLQLLGVAAEEIADVGLRSEGVVGLGPQDGGQPCGQSDGTLS